jgi:hypothetical protein
MCADPQPSKGESLFLVRQAVDLTVVQSSTSHTTLTTPPPHVSAATQQMAGVLVVRYPVGQVRPLRVSVAIRQAVKTDSLAGHQVGGSEMIGVELAMLEHGSDATIINTV